MSATVSLLPARRADREALLARIRAAGVRKPILEYEKAHTYPASQPFFAPLDAEAALAPLPHLEGPFWLYVHVPFCHYLCSFCFYKKLPTRVLETAFPSFLAGIQREVSEVSRLRGGEAVETRDLYLGGGTPTALETPQLATLLDSLEPILGPAADFLGTCEGSPESVSGEKVRLLLERGIRRFSLGAQSLDQSRLDAMRRTHRVEQTFLAYETLRSAGCDHVNVDLIYGFPGQTPQDWERELFEVLARMRPESLTLYYLRYVPGTLLAGAARSPERVPWADLITMREIYFHMLHEAGYEMCRPHFFRLPLERVRRYRGAPTLDHGNLGAQIGLGPSAYSHLGSVVSRNAWPASSWTRAVAEYGFGTAEGRRLTGEDRCTRALVKALVGSLGIDSREFARQTGGANLQHLYGERLDTLEHLGLISSTSTGYELTELGILFDEEVSYFLYPSGFQESPPP